MPPEDPAIPDLSGLPPLREEIRAAGLRATKSLGQNFLLDENLLDRIVRLSGVGPGDHVYEVGAGPGGLTRALLRAGARVLAIERDRRALPILRRLEGMADGHLTVVEGDALAFSPASHFPGPARIVANLPYNVGTALLTGWLSEEPWPSWWRSATLMFQRELAERVVADPDTSAYGRLSVLAQLRAEADIRLRVPAAAFTPPPKVESAVLHLVPKAEGRAIDVAALQRLTAAAFGQRRKMLRQSLRSCPGALAALPRLGISADRRAQTLTVANFASLLSAVSTDPADNS